MEKNFGLISTSMPSPFFERSAISFGCWIVKCAENIHANFLCLWDNSIWVFYYSRITFTFDPLVWRICVINRKIDCRSIPEILSFLGYFGCNYQEFTFVLIIVKPDGLDIGLTFFISGCKLQGQFTFKEFL